MLGAHNFSPYLNDLKKYGEKMAKMRALSTEILEMSRDSLLINLRFLDQALVRFEPAAENSVRDIETEGRYFYFNPRHILRMYKFVPENVTRAYLHVTLHCLFRHPFVSTDVHHAVWNLACDMAVENIINGLGLKNVNSLRGERQEEILKKFRAEVGLLSAEKLYRYILKREEKMPGETSHLRELFYADNHEIWYNENRVHEGQSAEGNSEDDDTGDESPVTGASGKSQELSVKPEGGESEFRAGTGGESGPENEGEAMGEDSSGEEETPEPEMTREEIEDMWKDISRRVQVDMETSSHTWGEGTGDLLQELSAVNREKYDYADFLRRFAVLGENIEVNDDEFDYILYTRGLDLYGNMPLIEPLEYKDVFRIRDFVIAIDTSESVSGKLVQSFVNKTYNILKQTENFFTKINVHIIQCGAAVHEDKKITSSEEMDEYLKTMRLYGFGGTDFRPLFKYVDGLLDNHEFSNFKGLIYFTDGYGTFPNKRPDYDAAFVFCADETDIPDVPPWAIRLVLSPEEIETYR